MSRPGSPGSDPCRRRRSPLAGVGDRPQPQRPALRQCSAVPRQHGLGSRWAGAAEAGGRNIAGRRSQLNTTFHRPTPVQRDLATAGRAMTALDPLATEARWVAWRCELRAEFEAEVERAIRHHAEELTADP